MSKADGETPVPADNSKASLVRKIRDRTGLTQEQFAAKLGVTFATVNRWENGRSQPSPLAMQRLEELVRGLGRKGSDLVRKHFSPQ